MPWTSILAVVKPLVILIMFIIIVVLGYRYKNLVTEHASAAHIQMDLQQKIDEQNKTIFNLEALKKQTDESLAALNEKNDELNLKLQSLQADIDKLDTKQPSSDVLKHTIKKLKEMAQ